MLCSDLFESSNDSLEVVLKRLKSHPDIKPIFRKGFNMVTWSDDYKNSDHKAITTAFRDIVLHSTSGAALFKEMNGDLSRLSSFLKSPDDSHSFIQEIIYFAKEASRRVRNSQKISAEVKRELRKWVEGNGVSYQLYSSSIKELKSIPDIRPSGNVVLYRGLLIKDWQLKDDVTHEKSGKEWLKAIEDGLQVADHTYSKPTSWTSNINIAERFARYRSSGSYYTAMLSALQRKGQIDGRVGLIISTLARPENIVCDISKLDLGHVQHGNESEMILDAGTYRVRIVKAWDKDGPLTKYKT